MMVRKTFADPSSILVRSCTEASSQALLRRGRQQYSRSLRRGRTHNSHIRPRIHVSASRSSCHVASTPAPAPTAFELRPRIGWQPHVGGSQATSSSGPGTRVRCRAQDSDDASGAAADVAIAPPAGALSGLVRGFQAGVQGGLVALKDPSGDYRKLSAVVVAGTVALDVSGVWVVYQAVPAASEALFGSQLEGPRALLVNAAVSVAEASLDVAVLFLAPLVAISLVQQLLPLLGESLFLGALRQLRPDRAEQLEGSAGLGVSGGLSAAGERSLLFLRWQLLLLAASLPVSVLGAALGAQLLTSLLQLLLSSYIFGWEMLDVWFDKRAFGLEAQRGVVSDHRWAVLGFAAPYALLLPVPLVGPFAVGLAQSAAARLVTDVLEEAPPAAE